MPDILICGTWRCGSTMICEDLANANLGRPQEHLNRWDDKAKRDWQAEFAGIRTLCTTPNGVFATKLMAGHLRKVDALLGTFLPAGNAAHYPVLASAFDDPLWVRVRRRDTVAQAVSSYVAKSTGIYHLVGSKKTSVFRPGGSFLRRPEHLKYDFMGIMRQWVILRRHDLVWDEFFAGAGIEPLTIWYEDHAETSAAPRIADAAGLSIETVGDRNLRKLADERSDALRAAFIRELMTGDQAPLDRKSLEFASIGPDTRYRRAISSLPVPVQRLGSRVKQAILRRDLD